MSNEAMKQALKKIRAAQQCHPNAVMALLCEADEVLEQAIAEAEKQEPLFWYKPYPNGMYNGPIHNAQIGDILRGSEEWVPLYTHPQPKQEQGEDLAFKADYWRRMHDEVRAEWIKATDAKQEQDEPVAYDGTATEGGARYQADQNLRALLRYTENFYGAAIKHGMKAGETANAIAHIEKAGKALHRLVHAWADVAEQRQIQPKQEQGEPKTDTEQINRGCWHKTDLTTPQQRKPLTEWQPIETAPKNSTSILIYCPRSERKPVCEAWWAIAYEGDHGGHWQTPIGPNGRGYIILETAPTHWMPLPTPPVEAAHGIKE